MAATRMPGASPAPAPTPSPTPATAVRDAAGADDELPTWTQAGHILDAHDVADIRALVTDGGLTIAELDGSDDEADWVSVGHKVDPYEADWLRERHEAALPAPFPPPGVPQWVAEDLVERRVRRGFNREQSQQELALIMSEHGTSPNLRDILVGEKFATGIAADRAVAAIAEEQSPGRVPSREPQTVLASVIRKGDFFADGEFATHERVVGVVDMGDFIAINTDASLDAGAEAYRFPKGGTVWAITP